MACDSLITVDMKADEDLPSIDLAELAGVTGGSTSVSDQVTLMLQQLMSSIKDLVTQQQSGGGDFMSQLLPMMLMMRGRSSAPPPPPPPPVPPPGDWTRVA
jgi:hypothetical protein